MINSSYVKNESFSYKALMLAQTDPAKACKLGMQIAHTPTLNQTMGEVISFAAKTFSSRRDEIEMLCLATEKLPSSVQGKIFTKIYNCIAQVDPEKAREIEGKCDRSSEKWKIRTSQDLCSQIQALACGGIENIAKMIYLSSQIEAPSFRIWAFCEIASIVPPGYVRSEEVMQEAKAQIPRLLAMRKDARIDDEALKEKDDIRKTRTKEAAALGLYDVSEQISDLIINRGIRENAIEKSAEIMAITDPERAMEFGNRLTIPFRKERFQRFSQLILQSREEGVNKAPFPREWARVSSKL